MLELYNRSVSNIIETPEPRHRHQKFKLKIAHGYEIEQIVHSIKHQYRTSSCILTNKRICYGTSDASQSR